MHLISDDTNKIGPVAGFQTPDKSVAILLENYSLEALSSGEVVFQEYNLDVVLGIVEEERGSELYKFLRARLEKEILNCCLTCDNEAVLALWSLEDGKALILAGDAGGSDCLSYELETLLQNESGDTFSASHFTLGDLKGEAPEIWTALAPLHQD